MNQRWDVLAIVPEIFESWLQQSSKTDLKPEALGPEAQEKLNPGRKSLGDVAVIRVSGFITQKPNIFTLLFGGTSTEMLAREVRAAMGDPSIASLILDVDSPGGDVQGVTEAANAIRGLRGRKPMIAVANPIMASAAYWLGAQADEVIATPSAIMGSIGVFAVHMDESAAIANAGIKLTPVTWGRMKLSGASFLPLSEEARASMQARVDYFGKVMESDIAKGRRISPASVHGQYGEGEVFTPPGAKARGLVDRIATLEEIAGHLARGKGLPPIPPRAFDPVEIAARASLAGIE